MQWLQQTLRHVKLWSKSRFAAQTTFSSVLYLINEQLQLTNVSCARRKDKLTLANESNCFNSTPYKHPQFLRCNCSNN
jgi:hypothetical protein